MSERCTAGQPIGSNSPFLRKNRLVEFLKGHIPWPSEYRPSYEL